MTTSSKQFSLSLRSPLVLIPVGMLVAAELAFRVPAVQEVLPQPQLYYDIGIPTRLDKLNALMQTDTVDLLFVGSSIVRTNIRPLVFDSVIAGHGHRTGKLVSFNGGFSGMHPDPTRLYLEHFWLPRTHPSYVLQGVAFGELTSERRAEEWEEFKSSRLERHWIENTGLARLNETLLSRVRLLTYQGSLTAWFTDGWAGIRERDFPIDQRGFGPTELTLTQAMASGQIRGSGTYGDSFTQADFEVGVGALKGGIAAARRRGVHFIIFNMPEYCGRYLTAEDGLTRYESYLATLREIASAEGATLIDVTRGDPATWCDKDLFSDHHHMSPEGARRLSIELGEAVSVLMAGPSLTRSLGGDSVR